MAGAGSLDRLVTIRRRPQVGTTSRGPYEDAFKTWGSFRALSVREAIEAGRVQNIENGTLMVRNGPETRTITVADRVMIQGRDFAIEGVGVPDIRTGLIMLAVASGLGGQ
ncbi:phage head completion protein [Methylobacterium sp. JK268]